MIPKECKRLAEVDFPIAVVSKHSAREKSIRHGHPSTLHLWWARRPLAACRAMLLGLLLPDPCDEHCPPEFREKARKLLPPLVGQIKAGNRSQGSQVQGSEVWELQKMQKRVRFNSSPSESSVFNPELVNAYYKLTPRERLQEKMLCVNIM